MIRTNCFADVRHPDDMWLCTTRYLNPIGIRVFTIVSKQLNHIVNQYRVMLALEHKDLSYEKIVAVCKTEQVKLFDCEIINELENPAIFLSDKAAKLKIYIDAKKHYERGLLCYFLSSLTYKYNVVDLLLRLGSNLNVIIDSYSPTPLFFAHFARVEPMRQLIDAGADWRIINPRGKTCFEDLKTSLPPVHCMQEITELEDYAKKYWEQLKREKTPIPAIEFTVQNRPFYIHDF